MKFLSYGKDGGDESHVWAYTFIEIKSLFSIVLLRFENGSREAYHTHAFNACSWLLSGELLEVLFRLSRGNNYRPSWRPILTKRDTYHRVLSVGRSWVLSFRGPWSDTWVEHLSNEQRSRTLTHGRVEI